MKEVSHNTADPVERKGTTWKVDWDEKADMSVDGPGYVVENGGGDELSKIWHDRQLVSDLAGKWPVEEVVVRGRPCLSQVESLAGLLGGMDMRRIGGEGGRQIRGPLGCLTTQGEDGGAWLCFWMWVWGQVSSFVSLGEMKNKG